jgi:hypothetical protein
MNVVWDHETSRWRIDVKSEFGNGSLIRASLPAAAVPEGGMIDGGATHNPPH